MTTPSHTRFKPGAICFRCHPDTSLAASTRSGLKYGTVPIVRATGGLDDTFEHWDPRTGKGTGFKFTDYNGEALLLTVKEALKAFRDQSSWQQLMRNGMTKDFSWNASAREYIRVYERVRQGRGASAEIRPVSGIPGVALV
jgi:glycogen synthase